MHFFYTQLDITKQTLTERTSQIDRIQQELDQRRMSENNLTDTSRRDKVRINSILMATRQNLA